MCSIVCCIMLFINCNFLSFYTTDDSCCFLDHDYVLLSVWVATLTETCCLHVHAMVAAWFCQHGYLSLDHVFTMQHITVRLLTVLTLLSQYICCWMAGWIVGYFTKYQLQWLFPVKWCVRMICPGKVGGLEEEVITSHFRGLSWHFLGETGKTIENLS
jgi:uncharacterized membrane protein